MLPQGAIGMLPQGAIGMLPQGELWDFHPLFTPCKRVAKGGASWS
jgi:hypothetical protein